MGTNNTQALGVSVFLLAFVMIALGMSLGGSLPLLLGGVVLLGISGVVFLRAKPWEEED